MFLNYYFHKALFNLVSQSPTGLKILIYIVVYLYMRQNFPTCHFQTCLFYGKIYFESPGPKQNEKKLEGIFLRRDFCRRYIDLSPGKKDQRKYREQEVNCTNCANEFEARHKQGIKNSLQHDFEHSLAHKALLLCHDTSIITRIFPL